MSRIWSLVVVVVAAAAFYAGDRADLVERLSPAPTSAATGEAERADGAGRLPDARPRRARAPRPAAEAIEGFALLRLETDTSGSRPRACFLFSERLVDDGSVRYEDYVEIDGAADVSAVAEGSRLCIDGLRFDRDYRVRLKAGLPGRSGVRLERLEDATVSFGDKPPFAAFAGDGIILPRDDADGLGIQTVNIDDLTIRVRRVGDRILARRAAVAGGAAAEGDYSYIPDFEDGRDVGVVVHEETISIDAEPNALTTTVYPLGAALSGVRAGAYFVEIEDASKTADRYDPARAWRWVLYTDIALTTYQAADGLLVVARSLSTAKTLSGVRLDLVAENNDVLATETTDGGGTVRFPSPLLNGAGPDRPRMLMAYGEGADFAMLDLRRAALDLSDRGVAGRPAAPDFDGYLYTDRGVYRPGERVFLTGLVRDASARAIDDRPGTLVVTRPNGTEAARIRVPGLDLGGFTLPYDIPKSAPRGTWRLEFLLDGAGPVGAADVAVEDFAPQQLEVTLAADEEAPLAPGDTRLIRTDVRFLYGAPGRGLAVEGEARLRLDPNPFPELGGFRFGPADSGFDQRFLKLRDALADGEGRAVLELTIEDGLASAAPLRADVVVAALEPGGRAVRESVRIPIRAAPRYVGVRLADGGDRVAIDAPAVLDVVLVDRGGAPLQGDVEWRLVEEDYWFDWYRENGRWRWRRVFRDVAVADGAVRTDADGRAVIERRLKYGSYRLVARDKETGAESALRFSVGWRSHSEGAASPDEAALTAPASPHAAGSDARLFLDPPYAGEATIVVANERIRRVFNLTVPEDGREIAIPTDPEWGAGVYVLATVVTPRSPADRPVPRRAMGVAYVPFDVSGRTLAVDLGAPALSRPRETLTLPVRIEGAASQRVRMTVSAVDEGILRLTKFASPDPVGWYFGKKRLAVEVKDDYARLLDPNLGAPLRSGGDQIGGEGLTVVPEQSVALFSGLVQTDPEGRASISFDVPDFNGELRIMASAWTADALGAAATPLTVRDPVPARLNLPRFLAPGDEVVATASVDNVEGEAGTYAVRVSAAGVAEADADLEFSLREGERSDAAVIVTGGEPGVGEASLSVEGPDGFSVSRSYPIQSRSAHLPVRRVTTRAVAPGEATSFGDDLVAGLRPGATARLTVSPLKDIAPEALMASLSAYPYGCTEQLVSTASPLLYSEALAGFAEAPGRDARARVQEAVNQILDRQTADGAFGLWRPGDRGASAWLAPYVVEFLERAKASGRVAPDAALDLAYRPLEELKNPNAYVYVGYQTTVSEGAWTDDTTRALRRRTAAYALYVLAKAGRADLSDLRYAHDAWLAETKSPLAHAYLGAALARLGDNARARSAFEGARARLGAEVSGDYYQSALRDAAGAAALAIEAGADDVAEDFLAAMSRAMKDPERMNTQEKAYVLRAGAAMLERSGEIRVEALGARLSGTTVALDLGANEFSAGASLVNRGRGPAYATVSIVGDPLDPPSAASFGFAVGKRIYRTDGSLADPASLSRNDRLIVAVSISPGDRREHPAILTDLLPPGFEIEATLGPDDGARDGEDGPYAFLGALARPAMSEARDDRFVAAIDIRAEPVTLAYLVRVTKAGSFALPGAVVEDMYRPGVFGRSAAGRAEASP